MITHLDEQILKLKQYKTHIRKSTQNFCTSCGLVLIQPCPNCSQQLETPEGAFISCSGCEQDFWSCRACARLYHLDRTSCVNSYCTQKDAKKLEKETKKAEKLQKEAEKKQKKAEKTLKKQQKSQDRLNKATKKLESSQKKYEKLKRKGKLSPQDETKWAKKLEGYKEAICQIRGESVYSKLKFESGVHRVQRVPTTVTALV